MLSVISYSLSKSDVNFGAYCVRIKAYFAYFLLTYVHLAPGLVAKFLLLKSAMQCEFHRWQTFIWRSATLC